MVKNLSCEPATWVLLQCLWSATMVAAGCCGLEEGLFCCHNSGPSLILGALPEMILRKTFLLECCSDIHCKTLNLGPWEAKFGLG